jgi:predicted small lipoprotein YifL
MRRALVAGLAALVLALPGCGRIGPVKQPGPREAITYPRAYPRYTDLPNPNAANQPAARAVPLQAGPSGDLSIPGVTPR